MSDKKEVRKFRTSINHFFIIFCVLQPLSVSTFTTYIPGNKPDKDNLQIFSFISDCR